MRACVGVMKSYIGITFWVRVCWWSPWPAPDVSPEPRGRGDSQPQNACRPPCELEYMRGLTHFSSCLLDTCAALNRFFTNSWGCNFLPVNIGLDNTQSGILAGAGARAHIKSAAAMAFLPPTNGCITGRPIFSVLIPGRRSLLSFLDLEPAPQKLRPRSQGGLTNLNPSMSCAFRKSASRVLTYHSSNGNNGSKNSRHNNGKNHKFLHLLRVRPPLG